MPGDTLAKTGDGLIAIAATFVSYGASELIHCYGFFAVFVTAITLRSAHRDHEFQRDMHDITEQVERIAMMVLLIAFGGELSSGLLSQIGWVELLAAVLILFVVRPLPPCLACSVRKRRLGRSSRSPSSGYVEWGRSTTWPMD